MQQHDEAQSFGGLLRAHRTNAGLTQEELAERAGLSRRGIADLERGARLAPYANTVDRLAAALGLSPTDQAALVEAARRFGRSAPSTHANRRPQVPAISPEGLQAEVDASTKHNLALQPTSFIGREQELAQVGMLLASSRLVTLVGTGGVGKTRLALEVAIAQVGNWPDGVWLVELAALAEPDLLSQSIALTVGIREAPGHSLLAHLVGALAGRKLLLVLDNCEHLIEACARTAEELIRHCPNVHVLATSRAPLEVHGEHEFPVPPLALPDPARPGRPMVCRTTVPSSYSWNVPGRSGRSLCCQLIMPRRLPGSVSALMVCRSRLSWLRRVSVCCRRKRCWRALSTGCSC